MSNIIEKIKTNHSGDNDQLSVIFSDAPRIMVEAPAGCGKTKTMISKIAYMIASGQLPKNKKILALTFSVNAAYKMKKDISEQLPALGMDSIKSPADINSRLYISNYHGFARRILGLYGYLLSPKLKEIYSLQSIDDSRIEDLVNLNIGLSTNDATKISNFNDAIKTVNVDYIKRNLKDYLNYVYSYFLPNNFLPYNAYLILFRELLIKHKKFKEFISTIYPIIIIDEFQDTNILSWQIIRLIVTENSKMIFLGDPLQRIYGFIGAIPNLIEFVANEYHMERIELKTNYRFKDNQAMLLLDRNIRENAKNWKNPSIISDAYVPFTLFNTQEEEISNLIDTLNYSEKTAILAQSRSENLNMLLSELKNRNIKYFFALFKEDDMEYITFHNILLKAFTDKHKGGKRISKSSLNSTLSEIKNLYKGNDSPIIESLIALSAIFFKRVIEEYSFLSNEEKHLFIVDAFANKSLKQNMEYVDSNLIISTVHGAKGLEWEYVFIPDMEQYVFPNHGSLCGICNFSHNSISGDQCSIHYNSAIEEKFIETLSVFYVAVTRARKQVYFSASKKRFGNRGETNSKISCLLNLPGISIK